METRLKANICIQCGKQPISGGSTRLCDQCLARAGQVSKRTKANNIFNNCCRDCGKTLDGVRRLCDSCCEKKQQTDKSYRLRIKEEVITRYGGKCVCCSLRILAFLTIDHIHGNGEEDREENGSGFKFYLKLAKQETDLNKYQVMCFNCNCGRARNKGVCPHISIISQYSPEWLVLKQKIVDHYGGACYCCHESNLRFLTIDHIDGGGKEHRRKIKGVGQYKWIIDNKFPSDLRVSCYNCNCGRGASGSCPHLQSK